MTANVFDSYEDAGIEVPEHGGRNRKAYCPKCRHDRKPANRRDRPLSIDVERGLWRCHNAGCDWTGRLRFPPGFVPASGRSYRRPAPPSDGIGPDALAWFSNRGIRPETVATAGVTSSGGILHFPYIVGGEVVNIKHRNLAAKRFSMEEGAELVFWGLDWRRDHPTKIACEGEIDGLTLLQETDAQVLSVPNGASVTDGMSAPNLTYMSSALDLFEQANRVYLAGDMDAPGRALMDEIARRVGKAKCLLVEWPAGCNDANETLEVFGGDVVRACLTDARPYPVKGIVSVADLREQVLDLYDNGYEKGVSTGWRLFDPLFTVVPGQLTVVTGAPGNGKSAWVDALLVNLAREHGWRFGVFSPEFSPLRMHVAALAQLWLGKPFYDGPTERMPRTMVNDAIDLLHPHFKFEELEEATVEAILDLGKVLALRDGIHGLVVDPWTEIDHQRESWMSETEYIHKGLSKIRQYGKAHGVHVVVVAHPTKLQKNEKGVYPVAKPYDISGSAAWANKADNILSVWRDRSDSTQPVQVHTAKIRFRQNGQLGAGHFRYDVVTGRYDALRWEAE